VSVEPKHGGEKDEGSWRVLGAGRGIKEVKVGGGTQEKKCTGGAGKTGTNLTLQISP